MVIITAISVKVLAPLASSKVVNVQFQNSLLDHCRTPPLRGQWLKDGFSSSSCEVAFIRALKMKGCERSHNWSKEGGTLNEAAEHLSNHGKGFWKQQHPLDDPIQIAKSSILALLGSGQSWKAGTGGLTARFVC